MKLLLISAIAVMVGIAIYLLIRKKADKSLYDRLGGIYSIAAVIDYFSDEILKSPGVGVNSPNPQLREWSNKQLSRLPGLKWLRTLWVCAAAGGPYKFIGTKPGKCPMSLENAHSRFKISPDEFDEVASVLLQSLRHFSVPEKETNEVMSAFKSHKPDVITGYIKSQYGVAPKLSC